MNKKLTLEALWAEVTRLRKLVDSSPRLHRKDLMQRYGFSKSTLHRLLNAGRLPRPIRFSGPLWRLEDLLELEEAGQLHPKSA